MMIAAPGRIRMKTLLTLLLLAGLGTAVARPSGPDEEPLDGLQELLEAFPIRREVN